jgi:hypothetical protein
MISFEDCVALCGLSPEEISAIAEHEHVPEVAATALASYLMRQAEGPEAVRNMIVDDIRVALNERRIEHAAALFSALRHYLSTHADARAGLVPN